ncbi:hypothetical protein NLU13_4035 [Sarocladium strictum]|uniref:FAS1 domain-containing protein n=1 Tax=Sarocladium strictum TaxID=5046 RepID=A0AA39GI47_SARSR|nr:hypothetical protein NLU13_4035 [Sarocladium strictum]
MFRLRRGEPFPTRGVFNAVAFVDTISDRNTPKLLRAFATCSSLFVCRLWRGLRDALQEWCVIGVSSVSESGAERPPEWHRNDLFLESTPLEIAWESPEGPRKHDLPDGRSHRPSRPLPGPAHLFRLFGLHSNSSGHDPPRSKYDRQLTLYLPIVSAASWGLGSMRANLDDIVGAQLPEGRTERRRVSILRNGDVKYPKNRGHHEFVDLDHSAGGPTGRSGNSNNCEDSRHSANRHSSVTSPYRVVVTRRLRSVVFSGLKRSKTAGPLSEHCSDRKLFAHRGTGHLPISTGQRTGLMIELLARHLDAKKIEIKETATSRKNDRGEVSNGHDLVSTIELIPGNTGTASAPCVTVIGDANLGNSAMASSGISPDKDGRRPSTCSIAHLVVSRRILEQCTVTMLFKRLVTAVASLTAVRRDDEPQDLGSVLAGHKNLTTYYSLIKKYPDILLQLPSYSGVTIIAPSNSAFENIPYTALNEVWDPEDKEVTVPLLQYHILQGTVAAGGLEAGPSYVKSTLLKDSTYTNVTSGQNVVINKSGDDVVVLTTSMGTRCTVLETDIVFQGGLIHIVDNLLIPPARLDRTTDAFKLPSFLGALHAADLMPGIAEHKNVTIFAPQDKALGLVGGTLENLDQEALRRVMNYHVVPNQVLVSSSLLNNSLLDTLAEDAAGQTLPLRVFSEGNSKYINSAQVVQPDILIANGILHIISNVVNPEAFAVTPNPAIGTQPPVFPVSEEAGVFTSDLPCTTNCPVTTTPTPQSSSADASTTTSDIFTSESEDAARPARPTGAFSGAAIGALGLGAGMVLL